jgi:hypothetical protein
VTSIGDGQEAVDTRPPNVVYGGDKLAFSFRRVHVTSTEGKKVSQVIEAIRLSKRRLKADLEKKKEDALVPYDLILQAFRHAGIDVKRPASSRQEIEARRELLETKLKGPQRQKLDKVNEKLVDECLASSEDQMSKKRKEILRAFDSDIGKWAGWSLVQLCAQLKKLGYTITPEANDSVRDGHHSVELKDDLICTIYKGKEMYRAAAGEPATVKRKVGTHADPRKQYVEDHHGVMTRRYVTRAISFYHLAGMFGVKFESGAWVIDNSLTGQTPRAKEHSLDSQSSVFNVRERATVKPGSDRDLGVGPDELKLPSGHTGRSEHFDGDTSREMTPDERASMQVRDGSGERQQMLSAAAVQSAPEGFEPKIIRGNKGERFDLGPETVGVVEIDLSVILREEIVALNQHSFASHEYKVAYDRYNSATDSTVKRKALDELSEYVYSAQKNREVVMDRIPNSAITRIQMTGTKKWEVVGGAPLALKTWVEWSKAAPKLKEFVRNVEKMTKLRDRAEPKMKERGSRT